MVRFEGAHVIEAEELKEIIDEETSNPTIERLMFVEVRAKDLMPAKVFPCYMEAYATESFVNAEEHKTPELMFQCCIVQSGGGNFGMVRVVIRESELGTTKRIWDKPPTKGRSEDTPWAPVEKEVQ